MWGWATWEHRPHNFFGCNSIRNLRLWCGSLMRCSLATGFRKAGLEHSNYSRQHSVAVKTVHGTAAYNIDDDKFVYESEGSPATRLLTRNGINVLKAPKFFSEQGAARFGLNPALLPPWLLAILYSPRITENYTVHAEQLTDSQRQGLIAKLMLSCRIKTHHHFQKYSYV